MAETDTEIRFSGKMLGINILIGTVTACFEAATKVFEKSVDVLDHAAEILGESKEALQAYTIMKVHEHRIATDPVFAPLKKRRDVLSLQEEISALDRSRIARSAAHTKKEREAQVLKNRLENEKGERRGPNIKQSLKTGTAAVGQSEKFIAVVREGKSPQPLTHHMSLPVVEAPQESVAG